MSHRYYVPASRSHPVLPLQLAWLLWLTSKHVVWPGWVWGVIWTLWAIIAIAQAVGVFARTAYATEKMDRVLGGEP